MSHRRKIVLGALPMLNYVTPEFVNNLATCGVDVAVKISDEEYRGLTICQQQLVDRFERITPEMYRQLITDKVNKTDASPNDYLHSGVNERLKKEFYVPKTIGKADTKKKGGR